MGKPVVNMTGWKMSEHGVPDSLLTVIERVKNSARGQTRWRCLCSCGGEVVGLGYRIRSGRIKSCGCIKAVPEFRHGETKTRLYRIWADMKSRCTLPTAKYYKNYGGRGIKICDEWSNDFVIFREWAYANGYADDLTIDRIDSNGNYEPSNCRWATWKEQENNTSHNVVITYNDKTMTLHQWSECLNIPYDTLRTRVVKRGWEIERAFTQPVQFKTINRRTKSAP